MWWVGAGNFSTHNLFLMQNDLFSTLLGRNISLFAPGLFTWQPVSTFMLIMKPPGSPACYCSMGRGFAMLMVITIDPSKKNHLPSQKHTSGWMRMGGRFVKYCIPLFLPGNVVAKLESSCMSKHLCLGQVCRSSVSPYWRLLSPCVAFPVLIYQHVVTT